MREYLIESWVSSENLDALDRNELRVGFEDLVFRDSCLDVLSEQVGLDIMVIETDHPVDEKALAVEDKRLRFDSLFCCFLFSELNISKWFASLLNVRVDLFHLPKRRKELNQFYFELLHICSGVIDATDVNGGFFILEFLVLVAEIKYRINTA
jgi:hypothetical protein